MKIAILSLWFSNDNYGQLLQCYALQRYYAEQGHDVRHIKYNFIEKTPWYLKIKKIFSISMIKRKVLSILSIPKRYRRMKEQKQDKRCFEEFRENYLNWTKKYNGYKELKAAPPEADMYVVGSDQVWNFYQGKCSDNRNLIHAVFLDFGDENIRRCSYAASWGGMKIDDAYIKEITPLLKRFHEITVREKDGIENCVKCGRTDAKLVCDPTLLLTADMYKELYANDESINSVKKDVPYVFLYYLDNGGKFELSQVYAWAEKKGLSIVYVGGNGISDKYDKLEATIPQWIYLVEHAEYVITNSFHCSVFSYLFKRKFGVIPMNGVNVGMNSRFASLFEYLGIAPRFIKDDNFDIVENDYL